MVELVYRRASLARRLSRVVVATDDRRIFEALDGKADVSMTRADHASGTDRVAEVAATIDADIVVNIQGDLPLLDPGLPDSLIDALSREDRFEIATAAVPISTVEEFENPNVVKVVCSASGQALYFSRAPVPHDRDRPRAVTRAFHHIGIYAYRRSALLRFASLPPTPLEKIEKLEQLRALENGIDILVVPAKQKPLEVDTEADLEQVRAEYDKLSRNGAATT